VKVRLIAGAYFSAAPLLHLCPIFRLLVIFTGPLLV